MGTTTPFDGIFSEGMMPEVVEESLGIEECGEFRQAVGSIHWQISLYLWKGFEPYR